MTSQIERRLDALEKEGVPDIGLADQLKAAIKEQADRRAAGITQEIENADLVRRFDAGELEPGSLTEALARAIKKRMIP